jgi:hypothetical protein
VSKRIFGHDAELIRRADELLEDEYKRNAEFNAELDGDEPLQIGTKIEQSAALFWVERVTYNEELEIWSDKQILANHMEAQALLESNDQLGLFRELTEAILRNRIAPFVGAGMSHDSGFPLWGEALLKILSRVESVDESSIRSAVVEGDYLLAAEMLWDADETQVKSYIRSQFAKSQIPGMGPAGVAHLLTEFSRGCIVTTNYDRIIENVIPSLDGYMHGRQVGNSFVPNLLRGARCLLKLHGDADNSDSYVFTKSQYDDAYGVPFDFKRPLPKALRQIFVSHSLLFLGCSLVQDRTLELFEHVKQSEDFEIPDHFALLSEPVGDESRVQRENRLLRIGVRPIWYPAGEHRYVSLLLRLAIDVSTGVLSL